MPPNNSTTEDPTIGFLQWLLPWLSENLKQNAGIIIGLLFIAFAVIFILHAANIEIPRLWPKTSDIGWKERVLFSILFVIFISISFLFWGQFTINQPPIVENLYPSPSNDETQYPGIRITWTANATDNDSNDQIMYRFAWKHAGNDDNWTYEGKQPGDNSWIWNTTGYPPGDYEVEVSAWNDGKSRLIWDGNFTNRKHADYTLSDPNQPKQSSSPIKKPTVKLLVTPKNPATFGENITWTAEASDPENDPVHYKFILENGRLNVTDWTNENTYTLVPGNFLYIAGSNPIMKVQVRDSRDEVPNDYYNNDTMEDYKIKENEKPCLTGDGLYFWPSSPHEYNNYSETISCEATAKDPNDDKISYRFILNCLNCREDRNHDSKWELKKPKNNTYPWTPSRKDIGEWNITVCIRDGNHADDNGCDDTTSKTYYLTPKLPHPM